MISQEAIEERSYFLWEREGRPHGRHDEHWTQAQAELLSESAALDATPAKFRGSASETAVKTKRPSAVAKAASRKPAASAGP